MTLEGVIVFFCLEDGLTAASGALGATGIGIRVTRDAVTTSGGALTFDLTTVGEDTIPFSVRILFGGISPNEDVGEGSNGRFDCETVGVGRGVTEESEDEHKLVELEDKVMLLCTELIELDC